MYLFWPGWVFLQFFCLQKGVNARVLALLSARAMEVSLPLRWGCRLCPEGTALGLVLLNGSFVVKAARSQLPAAPEGLRTEQNPRMHKLTKSVCVTARKAARCRLPEMGPSPSPEVEETWGNCSKMWLVS